MNPVKFYKNADILVCKKYYIDLLIILNSKECKKKMKNQANMFLGWNVS